MTKLIDTNKKSMSISITDGDRRVLEIASKLDHKKPAAFASHHSILVAKKIIQEAKRGDKPMYAAAIAAVDEDEKTRKEKKASK